MSRMTPAVFIISQDSNTTTCIVIDFLLYHLYHLLCWIRLFTILSPSSLCTYIGWTVGLTAHSLIDCIFSLWQQLIYPLMVWLQITYPSMIWERLTYPPISQRLITEHEELIILPFILTHSKQITCACILFHWGSTHLHLLLHAACSSIRPW